jgi:hypothetical protein
VHDAQEIRSVLDQILIEYGVDLVFSGHDHYYYRTVRNNITYITTGGAGADLYTNGDTSEWQNSDIYFSEFHYCNITVAGSTGAITVKIDVFIFNETDKSITLGDSFIVPSSESGTSTKTELITTTPTTSLSSTSITGKTTPLSFMVIVGIILIVLERARK